jgi:uncharacterized protein involved in exopolysaccharide biosynthesis
MPKRFWWIFIVMIPIGMTLGLLTSAVITYKMPKLYESEGIIEVTSPSQVTPPGKLMKPRQFSEQELGSITGADILERVVDGLELPSKWGMARDEANRLLKESIQCTLVSEANRISIKVRCRFREDARDVAIAIIKCYQVQKAQPSDAAQAEALSDLNKEIDAQKIRTSERRNAVSGRSYHGYREGEAEFQANLRMLEKLEQKLEEMGKSIEPFLAKVTVHQIPELPDKVASPDVSKNLLIGKVSGILVSPLLAWPVIILLKRRTEKKDKISGVGKAEKGACQETEW